MKPDRDGSIQLATTESEHSCDINSDMLLGLALRRRALAAEIAGLASYDCFNVGHESLIAECLRDALPGYSKASLPQLRRAGMEAFRLTGEACRSGTRKRAGQEKTDFETHFRAATASTQVRLLLQPLPRSGGASNSGGASSSSGANSGGNEKRK